MKEFIIDGCDFSTPKEFYEKMESVFTFGLKWKVGRNLDAFTDILRGGFGQHKYGNLVNIKWINMRSSRERLPTKLYNGLIEIMEEAENVIFDRFEKGE